MNPSVDGYWSGIVTRRTGRRHLLRGGFAAGVLLMTVSAFVARVRTFVPEAVGGHLGQAMESAGITDATIAWSSYLVAYALLLLAAIAIWLSAIALMIWPPIARTPDALPGQPESGEA